MKKNSHTLMNMKIYSTMINRSNVYYVCVSPSIKPHTNVTNNAWLLTDILCGLLSLHPASSDSFAFETIWCVMNANIHSTIQDFQKQNIKTGTMEPTKSLCSRDVFLVAAIYDRKIANLLSSENCFCGKMFLIVYFFHYSDITQKEASPSAIKWRFATYAQAWFGVYVKLSIHFPLERKIFILCFEGFWGYEGAQGVSLHFTTVKLILCDWLMKVLRIDILYVLAITACSVKQQ